MLLYDAGHTVNCSEYGIMIPIPPDRGRQVLRFLEKNYHCGARGKTMPYPGPVLDSAGALAFLGLSAPPIGRADLERVHSGDYIASLYGGGLEAALLRTFELYDSRGRPHRYEPDRAVRPLTDLFGRLLRQTEGTYLACALALAEGPGFCYYLGGGQHHARHDGPSGFCLLNDAAVALRKLTAEGTGGRPVNLVWIIDLDAHKGDGTAELIRLGRLSGDIAGPAGSSPGGENAGGKNAGTPGRNPAESAGDPPRIFTLSIHMARGWPLDEESLAAAKNAPGFSFAGRSLTFRDRAPLAPSDIDIGVDTGEEGDYRARLARGIGELERLSGKAPGGGAAKPDLILVIDGADPYEHDGLPSTAPLRLSLEQCVERDTLVYRYAADRNIPSAWVASGGYGERAWEPPAYFLQSIR